MQEQRHQGKSADNPHGHSSSDLRDLEALAVKKGGPGPLELHQPAKETQHRPTGSRTAVVISHALLKVPSPDVEVVVLFHHLFAVDKLLLELTFGIDTSRGGQQHQDEESGLHC